MKEDKTAVVEVPCELLRVPADIIVTVGTEVEIPNRGGILETWYIAHIDKVEPFTHELGSCQFVTGRVAKKAVKKK